MASDAGQRDGSADGLAQDAALVCPQSVSEWCSNHGCKTTWTEVLASPLECIRFPGPGFISQESRTTCGDYNIDVFAHVDQNFFYYYDQATGQLVAGYYIGPLPGGCLFGPPGGNPVCMTISVPGPHDCTDDGGADDADQDATHGDAPGSSD
jgi:hypothetical protein